MYICFISLNTNLNYMCWLFINQDFIHRPVLLTMNLLDQGFRERRLRSTFKILFVVTTIWHSLIVSQWQLWLMTFVCCDIFVMSVCHSLIQHRGLHDGCRMRRRKSYPYGEHNFTSDFHRRSCCPVICVSLFHVIVLSFLLWVLLFLWFYRLDFL